MNNHHYKKIVKSDWLSTVLTSALIGQFNRTVRAITSALKWLFFSLLAKKIGISCFEKEPFFQKKFVQAMINW